MDLQKIEYFLAVRDHGSINAAAHQLGVAQPTISAALRSLERELGVDLFHRIGRGVVPTSAGHALVGPGRRLVRALSSAATSVDLREEHLRGTLDIALVAPVAAGAFVEMLAAFHDRFPSVQVRLIRIRTDPQGLEMLREGDAELLCLHLPLETAVAGRPWDLRLDVLPLGRQEYWYAAPPGTPGLPPPGEAVPLRALPDIPLVIVPDGAAVADVIERELAQVGRVAPPAAVLEHREARMSFVARGIGATFLERSMLEAASDLGLECRPTVPAIRRTFGLVYSGDELSIVARAFTKFAATWVEDAPGEGTTMAGEGVTAPAAGTSTTGAGGGSR